MGNQAVGTNQYVAFLRAINVGGRVVKMAELKAIFETLDLREVSTFIASGNVIFRSAGAPAGLARRIETGLARRLGYPVAAMLRTTAEVARVAACRAFPEPPAAGAALYVGFLREPPAARAIRKALGLQTDVDRLTVQGREIYWLAGNRIAEATITGAAVEKALETPVTFRNLNTIARLAAKYPVA